MPNSKFKTLKTKCNPNRDAQICKHRKPFSRLTMTSCLSLEGSETFHTAHQQKVQRNSEATRFDLQVFKMLWGLVVLRVEAGSFINTACRSSLTLLATVNPCRSLCRSAIKLRRLISLFACPLLSKRLKFV